MATIREQLVTYYKNNLVANNTIKNPEKYFNWMLEGIDEEILNITLITFKEKHIKFMNSRGFNFESQRCYINFDVKNIERQSSFFHEVGHAIDFISLETIKKAKLYHLMFKAYSNQVILSNGKTLNDTVKEEVKAKAQPLYTELISCLQEEVFNELPKDLLERYRSLNRLYEEKKSLARKLPRKNTWGWLSRPTQAAITQDPLVIINWEKNYKSYDEALKAWQRKTELERILGNYKELNTVNKAVRNSIAYKEFNHRYGVVIDMLNGVKKINEDLLTHSNSYFKKEGNFGAEFWAECWALYVTHQDDILECTRSYLPESVQGFEELWGHIKSPIK